MSISIETINEKFNQLQATFKAFQDKQTERLNELTSGLDDPVTQASVDNLNTQLGNHQTELEDLQSQVKTYKESLQRIERDLESLAITRPEPGTDQPSAEEVTHKTEFVNYVRYGLDSGRCELPKAARQVDYMYAADSSDGPEYGWTIPKDMDNRIRDIKRDTGAMRQVAEMDSTSRNTYEFLADIGDATAGWVGERETRGETDHAELAGVEIPINEAYAMPVATQNLLDDSERDIEAWLNRQVARRLTEIEDEAFVKGDGVKKPKGILSYDTVDLSAGNSSWSWGKVGFVKSEKADGFPKVSNTDTGSPARGLISLLHSLDSMDRGGAMFMMNDLTLSVIRKFTDGDGNFIWQPSMTAMEPQQILGHRVVIDDYMPDVAANAFPIALMGREGYLIIDRQGTRMLRDPYTTKGRVKFYTTQRVGGGIGHYQQVRLLKIAA